MIAVAALAALLAISGVRATHLDTATGAERAWRNAVTTDTAGPCPLCLTPDCTLVPRLAVLPKPSVAHWVPFLPGPVAFRPTDPSPQDIRPPPAV